MNPWRRRGTAENIVIANGTNNRKDSCSFVKFAVDIFAGETFALLSQPAEELPQRVAAVAELIFDGRIDFGEGLLEAVGHE